MRTLFYFVLAWMILVGNVRAGALEDYVNKPDGAFSWKPGVSQVVDGFTVMRVSVVSQKWRDSEWRHDMIVVRPKVVRNEGIGFLFITGDGNGERQLEILKAVAERGGAVAAVITRVPNQPLYGGKKEDALIAYTFAEYMKTGDESWPLLFPMVKSAVRGMDVVQELSQKEWGAKVTRFVVSGASKRGWTTWLTGAVDKRVAGIAPMVIDMLNMKAQTEWARKVYGKQSEEINDYTEMNLVERMDDPAMVKLRGWVDPYSYRANYKIPKLLLLGTNDPYWTVDSLRHYWNELPEPKLVYQTPNAGHDLNGGREALKTLAAFFQMIADGEELPKVTWKVDDGKLRVESSCPLDGARMWSAQSVDRDFRDDKWASEKLKAGKGSAAGKLAKPDAGYRAYVVEAEMTSKRGTKYKVSTEAKVLPESVEQVGGN